MSDKATISKKIIKVERYLTTDGQMFVVFHDAKRHQKDIEFRQFVQQYFSPAFTPTPGEIADGILSAFTITPKDPI